MPLLPCIFFDFARTTARPAYPASLSFGDGHLQLLGYDVHDDPDDGVSFRFYWQTSETLPDDLQLWPLVYDDLGQHLSDPSQVPMIATVWYPAAAWQPGEIIVTETLPQLLPEVFHLGIAVGPEGSLTDPNRRFTIQTLPEQEIHSSTDTKQALPALLLPGDRHTSITVADLAAAIRLQPGHWAQLATFQRQGPFLNQLPAIPSLHSLTPIEANFGPAIQLTGFWLGEQNLQPGTTLPVLLQWVAYDPPQDDYTVFIHLLAPDGNRIAQSDAYPTWLTPNPTSQWPIHQLLLDSHQISLPLDLPPATYTLQVGLYHPQTLERLSLPDGSDSFTLEQIQVK